MVEGMDADVAWHHGTTVHGTVGGGSSLEISDREESPRGAIERDLNDTD